MNQSPTTSVPGCANCVRLERRVAELEERLAELEQRLNRNSTNSSTPPSMDPPWAKKPAVRKPTGKRPGGQAGHRGHGRTPLPPERVDRVVVHAPQRCRRCGGPLDEQAPRRLIGRHQVWELPLRPAELIEHQAYACRCPHCRQETRQPIPPSIRRYSTGRRLSATIGFLSAYAHGSRRVVQQVLEQVLGVPLSLGTLMAREQEMSLALSEPYRQAKALVRQSAAKHVDETGWKRAARHLWVAATATMAVFRLDARRNRHALQDLLGQEPLGSVCSDRYGVYELIDPSRRQLCWAHLKRDFQQCVDGGGAAAAFGRRGLRMCRHVSRLWRLFAAKRLDRMQLREGVLKLGRTLHRLLGEGRESGLKKVAHFSGQLLRLEPALWLFAEVEGIQPTNNHAERMLRPAVIWRKTSQGSHSPAGCRFVERMLTAVQSLKLRGRRLLDYLSEAIMALRQGLPPPSLTG